MVLPTFEPSAKPGQSGRVSIDATEQAQSWMDRASQRNINEQDAADRHQKNALLIPVVAAQAKADAVKAETQYDSYLKGQQTRESAYKLYAQAADDFDYVNLITDDKARASASREWLSRYAQLANIQELKPEMDVRTHLATSNIADSIKLDTLTAQMQSFRDLTKDMSPEDQAAAKRIKTGLDPRKSSAAIQYKEVVGPDGKTRLVAVDPREVGAHVVGSGETYGSGVSPVNQPPSGGPGSLGVFSSLSAGEKKGQEVKAEEDAKYQAELRKERPKKLASLKIAEISTRHLTEEIDSLIGKVSAITAGPGGVVLDKFPGTSAKDFEANLNSIKAVLGFQALQAMRDASPNGGALGQITDYEDKLLQSQLGNLDIGQSPKQLIENLRKVKQRVTENFGITRAAFTNQYGEADSPAAAPDISSMSTEQLKKRLDEIRGKSQPKK